LKNRENMKSILNYSSATSLFIMCAFMLLLASCSEDEKNTSVIEMLPIPAGSFIMGNADGTKEHNEQPARTVTLRGFFMSKTEVTQAQYAEIMGTNPSRFKGDNRPVENMTWYEALEFCNKLSEKEGRTPCYSGIERGPVLCDFSADGYRLPTEAEWEYACRAGTTTNYYSGDSQADLARVGWLSGSTDEGTADVGQLPANAWGLNDMHGNVFEWCWDWYQPDYYTQGVNDNPTGPVSGQEKICRGGSWFVYFYGHRSSFRSMLRPGFKSMDIGIRLVRKQ
jgi:formylglycine-generating enzyme required for sulfatase activity